MNILYLTYPKYDYLADQIYTGLCSSLGWNHVVDFPYKPHYHDPTHRIPAVPQNPGRAYCHEEIQTLLAEHYFELIILSTTRKETVSAYQEIAPHVSRTPVVLLDGDDIRDLRRDLYASFNLALYFKREYLLAWLGDTMHALYQRWHYFGTDHELFVRTHPLPFSIILETLPQSVDRVPDLDLSFVGLASHRNRIRAVNYLQTDPGIRFEGWITTESTTRRSKLATTPWGILKEKLKGDPYVSESERGTRLSQPEYFSLLRRSRAALSLQGAGFDTLRYWEIVASQTLMISERPDIYIPHNFEDRAHVLYCRADCRDVPELILTYVRDESIWTRMREAAYAHLLRFHTCEQRAKQMLAICRTHL